MTRVAGADGCRAGWVVAIADTGARTSEIEVRVVPSLDGVIADVRGGALGALAIDMPIGLPESGPRACDVAARRLLGPRRSSVFPAPVRAALGSADYLDACARSFSACGHKLSKQAYHLLPRIADVDATITPGDQGRVVEAHPELAFRTLTGAPMPQSKRTPAGSAARRAALVGAGLTPPDHPPRGAAADDVLDAIALITIARRVVAGTAERIGDGTRDARGLRMEIVA